MIIFHFCELFVSSKYSCHCQKTRPSLLFHDMDDDFTSLKDRLLIKTTLTKQKKLKHKVKTKATFPKTNIATEKWWAQPILTGKLLVLREDLRCSEMAHCRLWRKLE